MTTKINAFAFAALAFAFAPLAGAGTADAAALFPRLLTASPSLVQQAECEDECQDLMEAREQAHEAQQDAAHEAAELRDEFSPRQEYEREPAFDRGAGKRAAAKDAEPALRAKRATSNPVATANTDTKTETPAKPDKITTADTSEPKVIEKVIEKIEKNDASAKSASGKGCKQYFAAIGMTLSVPCEK